ncbi:hypothetical protein [Aestuariivivens sediminicola]|uniref:hypothetical protein n=1 Tax=Aestuariivivens sediminicola TaxID=2913560 RepID=UPI001F57E58C|nr:hypothetical protein [Aestuariivivens sediminicola]
MALPATMDALLREADQYNLYEKLVVQLNKDFLLANIDLGFDENILPQSLKLLLKETIYRLIQEKFADYLNLLYIIDVPEKQIRSLSGEDMAELSEQVTFLILRREWQKVWYRNKYLNS